MFADHQPQLSKLGRSGPEGLERIITFVLCTIRVQLYLAVLDYPLARRGEPCTSIFGWKHGGLAYLRENRDALYEQCERQFYETEGEELEDGLLNILQDIPGIGPAKAGFVAQMVYGVSGCLDAHNLERFQISYQVFKDTKHRSPRRKGELIRDYNQVCCNLGGTAFLWDSWCQLMHDRDPANYLSADHVSAMHLAPLHA